MRTEVTLGNIWQQITTERTGRVISTVLLEVKAMHDYNSLPVVGGYLLPGAVECNMTLSGGAAYSEIHEEISI